MHQFPVASSTLQAFRSGSPWLASRCQSPNTTRSHIKECCLLSCPQQFNAWTDIRRRLPRLQRWQRSKRAGGWGALLPADLQRPQRTGLPLPFSGGFYRLHWSDCTAEPGGNAHPPCVTYTGGRTASVNRSELWFSSFCFFVLVKYFD